MAAPTTIDPVTATPPAADPAPLGLAGFAMTTLLLSAFNIGHIPLTSGGLIFVGMALFYGGLAQFMAGMWEFRNRNTFGATAFGSYGAFWMGVGILFVFDVVGHPAVAFWNGQGTIWFLFAWTIFTGYMTIAALRTNGAVLAVFAALTLTFLFLWLGALQGPTSGAPGKGLTDVGGWLGIVTAILAWYTSLAGVANSTWGRVIFPVFPLNPA